MAENLATHLGDATADAVSLVEVLEQLPTVPDVFLHGDFGPHNLLWHANHISDVVDFDHAAAGDPAIDVAPLIGFHGARAVAEIVDPDTRTRAMHHRAALSLQVAVGAHLCGLDAVRNHALANFLRRREAGTLHDPAGERPERFS